MEFNIFTLLHISLLIILIDGECLTKEKAAERLKYWAKSLSDEMNTMDFNGTPLTVIETVHGPSWYLVHGGWEGSLYYGRKTAQWRSSSCQYSL